MTAVQLIKLAQQKRSVSWVNWPNPVPAAFVIGMPFRVVMMFLKKGLKPYRPQRVKGPLPR